MSESDPLTRQQKLDLIVSVGSHLKDRRLSPTEVATLIDVALAGGMTRTEIQELLQVKSTQLGEFLKLLKLDGSVRDMAGWRTNDFTSSTIPFSSLALLRGLSAAEQREAATAILEFGLTWKETVALTQIRRRSGGTVGEAIDSVLAQRPTVERRHVLIGSIAEQQTRDRLRLLSQRERDDVFARTLEAHSLSSAVLDARLTPERFVLVTSVAVSDTGYGDAQALEDQVNAELVEALA